MTCSKSHKSLILLARQAGVEPAPYGLEVRCSIQQSCWRLLFDTIIDNGSELNTISDDLILTQSRRLEGKL